MAFQIIITLLIEHEKNKKDSFSFKDTRSQTY